MLKLIEQNLPAIIVILPLLFAPLLAMLSGKNDKSRYLAWLLCFAVCGLTAAHAGYQLARVEIYGATSYSFGNWANSVGIEHLPDRFNSLLILFVALLSFVTMPYALTSIGKEVEGRKIPIFYACFLLCISGLLGMLSTNDLFNFFVFLEVSSITSYAMVALGKDKQALLAAFKYLIIGSIGATLYLLGIMFVYAQTGTLNFGDAAQMLVQSPANKVTIAGFCFIIAGLMIKAGVLPLASWLPNAYAQAPSYVSGFLAGTATKVALFALIKVLFTLFSAGLIFEQLHFDSILKIIAVAAMLYGSVAAIYQSNVKKLLAYSSIANIGYIILGVAMLNQAGLTSAIFNFIAHGVAKTGAFLAIGVFVMQAGSANFKDFAGMGKKMPFTTILFLIFGLSLIGTPLTAGFISKWYLINAAIEEPLLLLAILLSSVLALVYIWRIVEAAYFTDTKAKYSEPDSYSLMPLWALAAAIIYFGIYPSGLLRLASGVAGDLLQ